MQKIAAASHEQTQSINQVSNSMSEMDKVVQANAANSEETASAAEELSSLGAELEQMVDGHRAIIGNGSTVSDSSNLTIIPRYDDFDDWNEISVRSPSQKLPKNGAKKIKKGSETTSSQFTDDFSGF